MSDAGSSRAESDGVTSASASETIATFKASITDGTKTAAQKSAQNVKKAFDGYVKVYGAQTAPSPHPRSYGVRAVLPVFFF
mmetsp:Transcript_2833/g.7794  ORF Transcript_2833/g.7794 Transcript_2833/m.7794 type:complete len:81 (+) Transcript_2833:3-245(+)